MGTSIKFWYLRFIINTAILAIVGACLSSLHYHNSRIVFIGAMISLFISVFLGFISHKEALKMKQGKQDTITKQ